MSTLAYPSRVFPGPPSVAVDVPEGWMPVHAPGTAVAAKLPREGGFGPNVVVHPQKNWYAGVQKEDLPEIVNSLGGGPAVTRLDTIDPSLNDIVYSLLDAGVV